MKRIFLTISLLFISMILFSQQKYDTDFTQTKMMKVSGITIEKTGHLVFDGNDQLTMTYTEPFGEYFNIEGSKVKMNLDGKKSELNADKVKAVNLQRTTLLNCLSGDWERAAVDNNAEVSTTEENGFKTIELTAKGKVQRGGYSAVTLTYRIVDGALVKMILEEPVGIINTYEMKQK